MAALGCLAATGGAPDYIFYFIGDGMGQGHVMAADWYNRTVLGSDSALLMMRFPGVGAVRTYSASSPITKSPAAGTALSTGHKTNNNMIGVLPDTTAVQSIAVDLKQLGYGIGLVTSVAPDDATPAAFYAHVPARSMYYEIGRDVAASGVDFLAGASLRGAKDTDLLQVIGQSGVTLTTDPTVTTTGRTILLAHPERRFNDNNIGYSIDSIFGALTLPEMTQACLRHLERNSPSRFFMMVEGGNIDHAAHANDAGAVVREVIAYQDAIQLAYDWYLSHPDNTLIVVTADHDTGGMALGNNDIPYDLHLEYLKRQWVSKDAFQDQCRSILKSRMLYTWDDMKELLANNFGLGTDLKWTPEQEKELKEEFEEVFSGRNQATTETYSASYNDFVEDVFKLLDSFTGVGWTSHSHTANLVPVYAIGDGSDRFGRVLDNTEIPKIIMQLVGR